MIDEVLKSHFLNLYHILLSDTVVDPTELATLYAIGIEKGVDKEEINQLLFTPCQIVIPQALETKIEYLYDFARMIWSDNNIDENELQTLKLFCRKFGFYEENIEEICQFLLERAKQRMTTQEVINQINNL